MHAGRSEPDHGVARCDVLSRQQLVTGHSADREAGKVIVAGLIDAGHLSRLAADQRAARLPARCRDALDHRRADLGIELAAGKIVEEEQRFGALHDEVVDRHGDEIDADRVVACVSTAILTLVPTPSVAATRIGSEKPARFEIEQPAEAADLGVGARAARSCAPAA